MAKKGTRQSPKGLGPAGRRFWTRVTSTFELELHHLDVLEQACLALDRASNCRASIDRDGETFKDRWGQVRSNPACATERDARRLFLSACRELGLDVVGAGPNGRPPGR